MCINFEDCRRPAVVVDHIKPFNQGGEFWDPGNHQAMCKSCHDRKTAKEPGGFSRFHTDNSHLDIKVALRQNHLPRKKSLMVLDCYHGEGAIWNHIKRSTEKTIQVVGIDKRQIAGELQLRGDNLKFIRGLHLGIYDVIDLDTYGVPYGALRAVLGNRTLKKGTAVFLTFIQTVYGRLPPDMLSDLGYSREMVRKCRSLFSKNGFDKMKAFLGQSGVKKIAYISVNNKFYIHFNVE